MNEKESSINSRENINYRCDNCPSKNTFKLETIADLQWEEHYHDYSKSILNPKQKYNALFILTSPKLSEVHRICLPDDWLLRGEDLIDLTINNTYCPFYQCPFEREQNRLVIDFPFYKLISYDSFYLIVNSQDIWNSKALVFIEFLKRLDEKKFSDINLEDIDIFRLDKAFIKKSFFKNKKYIFHYLIFTEPFGRVELVDYWIKIPGICNLKESFVISSEREDLLTKKADVSYLNLINKSTLKKILKKKALALSNKEINKKKVEYEKELIIEKDSLEELSSMSYQSSDIDSYLYHKRLNNLEKKMVVFRTTIKFKKEILIWFWFPLIFSIFQMILSFLYLFFYDTLIIFLPNFNSWQFLTFSINIFVLLLVALNWGSLQHLKLFKPNIFLVYLIYLLISLVFLMISLIFGPVL